MIFVLYLVLWQLLQNGVVGRTGSNIFSPSRVHFEQFPTSDNGHEATSPEVVLDYKYFLSVIFVQLGSEMSVCSYDSLKDFAVCTSKLSGKSSNYKDISLEYKPVSLQLCLKFKFFCQFYIRCTYSFLLKISQGSGNRLSQRTFGTFTMRLGRAT